MPAAIPIALAGASLIGTNMQQKAAVKNNENQQKGAQENAAAQGLAAQNQYNSFANANPSPFSNATVRGPRAGGYSQNPALNANVRRILQSSMAKPVPGGPVPPIPPAQMNAFQQQQPMQPQTSLVNAIIGS